MRKVAAGEAPQQRGKSFGGIPTRFDNRGHMLLKEDELDPAATQEYGKPEDRDAWDHEHDWNLEQAEEEDNTVNVWLVCSTCGAEAGPTNIPITEQGTPSEDDDLDAQWGV